MKDIIDAEGNVIPPPDASSDIAKTIYLLEYCRKRRFVLGPVVQVGEVIIQVKDPTLERSQNQDTRESDIWEEHGHREG